MRLIGVDVGGTFTDLVYADTEAGETAVHKVSTTPDDPSRGVVAGLIGALRQVRHPARDHRHGVPRHHHRHQRHPRARRRGHRHDHDRRLSRHPAHRPPPAAAALLDHAGHPLAGPAAGQAPPSQDGEGAAGAAQGRGAGAARRGRRAPGRARAEGSGRAGDRHLLPVLLPRCRARGARAWRSCARNIPSASPRPPRRCRRSSASSSASPRRR